MANKNDEILCSIQKNPYYKIAVMASEFQGHTIIHVREMFMHSDTEEWMPSKRGIAISRQNFKELKKTINKIDLTQDQRSEDLILGVIQLNTHKRIVISRPGKENKRVQKYNIKDLLDIRTFFQKAGASDEWLPGPGIAIAFERAGELVALINEAEIST